MAVVLDAYVIPEKGEFEINFKRKVNLQVTAEEARRIAHRWLLHQVSYMMGAQSPELVVNQETAVWRIPVMLTASHVGPVGIVGHVEVDVETGAISNATLCKTKLLQAAQTLAAKLPPYQLRTEMPAGYVPITNDAMGKAGQPEGNPLHLLPPTTRSLAR